MVLAPAGGQAANLPCQCRETWQLLARGALWAYPAQESSVAPWFLSLRSIYPGEAGAEEGRTEAGGSPAAPQVSLAP